MEFSNQTGWPAAFQSGSTGAQEMIGMAGCKATFRMDRGRLVPAAEAERWPLFDEPRLVGEVKFSPDLDYRRRGTDLVVIGKLRSPGGRPVAQLPVELRCGTVAKRSLAFGDRIWERSLGRIRPTSPRPFVELPLSNALAYGGTASFQGQPLPHAINPQGRGFVMSKESAEGQPLPNLERPDRLIAEWTDQPPPACWHKPTGPMELAEGGDPQQALARILEGSLSQTVPDLVLPPGQSADRVYLAGFFEAGPVDLPMPPAIGPVGMVTIGAKRSKIPSFLSSVVLLPDSWALVATYLCIFRYLLEPRELRALELRWPGGPHA